MPIRNSVKAIIHRDGEILLIKCHDSKYGTYYTLPGGGQEIYESFHDAVIRECVEETGYKVRPIRLATVSETIFTDEKVRIADPDHTHRVYFVFLCEVLEGGAATNKDEKQVDLEWVKIDEIVVLERLFPQAIGANLHKILSSDSPMFLGTEYTE